MGNKVTIFSKFQQFSKKHSVFIRISRLQTAVYSLVISKHRNAEKQGTDSRFNIQSKSYIYYKPFHSIFNVCTKFHKNRLSRLKVLEVQTNNFTLKFLSF